MREVLFRFNILFNDKIYNGVVIAEEALAKHEEHYHFNFNKQDVELCCYSNCSILNGYWLGDTRFKYGFVLNNKFKGIKCKTIDSKTIDFLKENLINDLTCRSYCNKENITVSVNRDIFNCKEFMEITL